MNRLLLINPAGTRRGLGNLRATSWPPLNLPYIAACTPGHYRIELIDENIEPFAYRDADLVGITAFTSSAQRAYQIARMYREKGIPTVMGGIHVSMLPDEALRCCDAVVVGEAESVWPQVIADFEAGRLQGKYQGSWASLDRLPIPRRDILRNSHYRWGSFQTSRGCPMDCSFCSVTAFNGRRYRRRPLEAVIEELRQIPQKRVMIADDNIIGYGDRDREWACRFFEAIIRTGIRKTFFAQTSLLFGEDPELVRLAARAGVRIVFVGLESVSAATLKSYDKKINLDRLALNRYPGLIRSIRREGIALLGAFVLGGDDDTRATFPATLAFIRAAGVDVVQVTKPTPLPGTRLWEKLDRENRILNRDFPAAWDDYRLTRMVYTPAGMSIDEVYQGFTYLRRAYYGVWETFKRTLSTIFTTRSLTAAFLAFSFNASYRKAFRASDHYRSYRWADLKKKFRMQRA